MRFSPVIAFFVALAVLSFSAGISNASDASICRSPDWERQIVEVSAGSVDIIAVCPKKASLFIELSGSDKGIALFKQLLTTSDLNVTGIAEWGETAAGTLLLRVTHGQ
ncbi:MAG: hypothetical protein JSV21_03410 [Nitrospirota bacterium]|nr:MAG: hypothetical protein JSV21_03410 [Nitrospirota bacterium]